MHRKHLKKIISSMLILSLAAGMTTACSKKETDRASAEGAECADEVSRRVC